jgi:hypothetical protein
LSKRYTLLVLDGDGNKVAYRKIPVGEEGWTIHEEEETAKMRASELYRDAALHAGIWPSK